MIAITITSESLYWGSSHIASILGFDDPWANFWPFCCSDTLNTALLGSIPITILILIPVFFFQGGDGCTVRVPQSGIFICSRFCLIFGQDHHPRLQNLPRYVCSFTDVHVITFSNISFLNPCGAVDYCDTNDLWDKPMSLVQEITTDKHRKSHMTNKYAINS